jgi:hypothetical protein
MGGEPRAIGQRYSVVDPYPLVYWTRGAALSALILRKISPLDGARAPTGGPTRRAAGFRDRRTDAAVLNPPIQGRQ